MTREDAILWMRVLKHSKINWVGEKAEEEDIIKRCEEAEQEAFDMAIEALSADAVPIHEDGTLEVKVPNAQKVGRVLVMDTDSHIGGGLFYPESADVVQGDGRNNIKRYPNCQMRTSLGNCDAIGGFCTSINAPICDAFHKLSEAVQGEWVDDDGNNVPLHKDGYTLRSCYCNQCHEWLVGSDEYSTKGNFCPNCGAKMGVMANDN